MFDLYSYCRKDILQFYKFYFIMLIIASLPVLVIEFSFFETETSGSMGEDGRSFGYLMFGLTTVFQITAVHYMLLLSMTNNFDLPWLGFFIFGFMWVWTLAALSDANKLSPYYKSIYTVLFRKPEFWVILIASIAVGFLPIYGWLKYRQFFGGDPRHDIHY